MTIQKKRIITAVVLILVSLVLSGLICRQFMPKPMLHGDYPYYPDIKSITEAADVIVVGEVVSAKNVQKIMVDKTPNKGDKESTPYTISTIRISRVIKGDVKVGDTISIKQLGDYKNNPEETLYKMDGYLSKNTEQLMFLCQYEESPYSPVNPAQGIIEVKDGILYSNNRYSLFGYSKTSVKENADDLDLAIEAVKDCIKEIKAEAGVEDGSK